jgi:hypothetical protein
MFLQNVVKHLVQATAISIRFISLVIFFCLRLPVRDIFYFHIFADFVW